MPKSASTDTHRASTVSYRGEEEVFTGTYGDVFNWAVITAFDRMTRVDISELPLERVICILEYHDNPPDGCSLEVSTDEDKILEKLEE